MADKTPVCRDWENREFVDIVSANMKRLGDFLNRFDASVRYKLGKLNEKVAQLERQVEYIEQCFSSVGGQSLQAQQ